MALIQQFTVSQNQAATIIQVNDDTGLYNNPDNLGGYGSPNTARADLALILIAKYKAIAADESLTPDTYDPEIIELWSIPNISKDGHYEFKIYPVDKKTGAETPALNDFVYDFSGNQLQRWNGSSWVSATNAELETNDVTHTTVDYPVLALATIAFNNVNKLYISGSRTTSRPDLKAAISDTSALINGSLSLFAEGAFAQAQDNIERYQSRVDTLANLT